MPKKITTIQKCAWGFAALFLGVYLLDYVPGIMYANDVQRMARAVGNHVAAQVVREQRQVADQVEDLVPGRLVGVA